MKETGIVRRIDDLGRVVIPKAVRKDMGVREGDPLEIYQVGDCAILRKYQEDRIPPALKALDEEKVQAIAERCADLQMYDDDDFTPPDSVPDFDDAEFWDWVQDLLRASARNALGILQDEG